MFTDYTMPKKFANENPKVTAARDRKAETKKAEADKKQKVTVQKKLIVALSGCRGCLLGR